MSRYDQRWQRVNTQINADTVNINSSNVGEWEYKFTLKSFDGAVRALFSPDGQMLASCNSLDSRVQIWSVTNGDLLHVLYDCCGDVNDIAFSTNNEYLAAGCEDKKVRIWSISREKIIDTLESHPDEVWRVAFSKDGRRFASASVDGTVLLWKTYGYAKIEELHLPDRARGLSFYPRNSMAQHMLVSIDNRGCIQRWGTENGKQIDCLDSKISTEVFDMTISSDDNFLAFSAYNTVYLWNLTEKKYYGAIFNSPWFIWSVAFDPNSWTLALGHENGDVELYNPVNKTTANTLGGHTRRVRTAVFSNDGQFLATGSEDKSLRIWKRSH